MTAALAMREADSRALQNHLFPGDGKESAALVLCGSGASASASGVRLMAREVIPVDPGDCRERTGAGVDWSTEKYLAPELVERMDKRGLSLVTAHSHPAGCGAFSRLDDWNDRRLFPAVHGWFDDGRPHGALVMLPDGTMFGRAVDSRGRFTPFSKIRVAGDRIRFWTAGKKRFGNAPEFGRRVAQTFGKGTFRLLRELRVGVVGCSGTGSVVAELLARNCVGEIVLADADRMEEKNLNRILNSAARDARAGGLKVDVVGRAIRKMGMRIKVEKIAARTHEPAALAALKTCDAVFGCVDSAEGRYHLDCLSAAYLIPYFDVGVRLDADGQGGISHAVAAANYVRPGGESLLERGVYTPDQVRAEGLRRGDPEYYEQQRAAGYLAAADEDHPAVVSLNMQAACLAVNDFLARLHDFRLDDNAEFAVQKFSLTHGEYSLGKGRGDSAFFAGHLGAGDRCELLRGF